MSRWRTLCLGCLALVACPGAAPEKAKQVAHPAGASASAPVGAAPGTYDEAVMPGSSHLPMVHDKPAEPGTRMRCVVSKDRFTVKLPSPRSEHNFRHYVFCSEKCKKAFDADPKKYAIEAAE